MLLVLMGAACGDDATGSSSPDATTPGPPDAGTVDVISLPQCSDGLDNDGNGVADFPFDPACDRADDLTEDGVPSETQCSDGLDNDGNGWVDYPDDDGCASASDDLEYPDGPICGPVHTPIDLGTGGVVTGTIEPGANELMGTCATSAGNERIYLIDVPGEGRALYASTDHADTALDTVLYVRKECYIAAGEIGCDDDNVGSTNEKASTVVVDSIPTGEWFVIVDAKQADASGDFTLTVSLHSAPDTACDPTQDAPCLPGYECTGAPPTCEELP